MITSSFTGNLGNHLWIYSLTRMVAEKNNYEWGFNPITEYDYYQGLPQMDFMEVDYGIKQNTTYNDTPDWCKNTWYEKYNHLTYPNGDTIDYHYYQPDVCVVPDNTKLYIRCCQDARYLDSIKDEVRKWFRIKEDNLNLYKSELKQYEIDLNNEDLTVINVRGGEYKGVPSLILQKKYWRDAIEIMRSRNSRMKFIGISDDVRYATELFDFTIPVIHLSIGGDYYALNNAKNMIISNSSFAIFPTWLNEKNPFVIAPEYWARHNVSTGYWASTFMPSFGWNFLGRSGILRGSKDYTES